MDNVISTNLTLDTFLAHEGKGHLDGGHSGRYPWGSGVRSYQSLEPTINTIKNNPVPSENAEYSKVVKFISPKLFAKTATADQLRKAIADQEEKSEKIELRNEFLKNQKRLSKGKPLVKTSKKRRDKLSDMSDEELKTKTKRLELEKQYLELKKQTGKVTARKQFIDKLKNEATSSAASLSANAATNAFISLAKKYTPLDFSNPKSNNTKKTVVIKQKKNKNDKNDKNDKKDNK